MNSNSKSMLSDSNRLGKKERIETQIHRRRKIKALSPLESEWECLSPGPLSTTTTQTAEPK
jgi:hypothetical protein